MSPIESMEWVGNEHLAVRYGDSVILMDVNKDPSTTTTLIDTEALVNINNKLFLSLLFLAPVW